MAAVNLRSSLAAASIAVSHALGNAAGAQSAQASDPLNFTFERMSAIGAARPMMWMTGGNGFTVSLDTTAPQSGRYSLRIQANGAYAPSAFGIATQSIPTTTVAGRTVRFSGYVRTENVQNGYAGLWLRGDGTSGRTITLDNMSKTGPRGSTPWTKYEIAMLMDSATSSISFGAILPGDGTAWFDSLSLSVDKQSTTLGATLWQASDAEITWVRNHAAPLNGSDPRAPYTDMTAIGNIVGDAHIVSLGEGTHGTSEFFKMKHRITEYLAREKGFTVFAIEASMPEARRINEYVLRGTGNAREALRGIYFWTWDTQEVLDMIEWMREFNASGKGRMEFWGFDVQTPDVAMDSIRAFIREYEPTYEFNLQLAFTGISAAAGARNNRTGTPAQYDRWANQSLTVLRYLESQSAGYRKRGADSVRVEWLLQYARIVVQGAHTARLGTASRDQSMAANVDWIQRQHLPGTKMVLWAHNGHVNRVPGWMGDHLHKSHGTDMRVFGFAMGEGDYTAFGPRGVASYPSSPPIEDSFESAFRATGVPNFVLDLRAAQSSPDAAFLNRQHQFRSIGSMPSDLGFFPLNLVNAFDAIIYFDRTKPSAAFGSRGR